MRIITIKKGNLSDLCCDGPKAWWRVFITLIMKIVITIKVEIFFSFSILRRSTCRACEHVWSWRRQHFPRKWEEEWRNPAHFSCINLIQDPKWSESMFDQNGDGIRSGAILHKHVLFKIRDSSEFQTIYSSNPVQPKHRLQDIVCSMVTWGTYLRSTPLLE